MTPPLNLIYLILPLLSLNLIKKAHLETSLFNNHSIRYRLCNQQLSQYISCPKIIHFKDVVRVLQYLKFAPKI